MGLQTIQLMPILLGGLLGLGAYLTYRYADKLEARAKDWAKEPRPPDAENIGELNKRGDEILRLRSTGNLLLVTGAIVLAVVILT